MFGAFLLASLTSFSSSATKPSSCMISVLSSLWSPPEVHLHLQCSVLVVLLVRLNNSYDSLESKMVLRVLSFSNLLSPEVTDREGSSSAITLAPK